MRLLAPSVALIMLSATGGCDATESDPEVTRPAAAPSSGGWRTIAEAPLSPRHGAAAVWTGSEVVVVGGDTQDPCPPGADCAYTPRPSAEAAAYDPVEDVWRELPDAPVTLPAPRAAWTGDEVVVVSGRHTLALDPAAGTWRELEPSPDVGDFVVSTDDGLLFVSYQQHPPAKPVDWLLDPGSGTWSALPGDPFGESYDRSMAWDGERLWLLSMAVEHHFGAHEGSPSRIAVLEGGEWRVVEDETPPLVYEQDVWWYDDRLVVPAASYGGETRVYDPTTREWSALPAEEAHPPCPMPPAGAGPEWLAAGGSALVSARPATTLPVPECDGLDRIVTAEPDVAVWAGEALVIWGSDFRRDTTLGMTWAPPAPG